MQPKPHRRFSFLALPYGKGPSQTVGEVFINTNKAPSVALSAAFHKGEGFYFYFTVPSTKAASPRIVNFPFSASAIVSASPENAGRMNFSVRCAAPSYPGV